MERGEEEGDMEKNSPNFPGHDILEKLVLRRVGKRRAAGQKLK